METGSIFMLIFGLTLLYGGLGFFISKAVSSEKKKAIRK